MQTYNPGETAVLKAAFSNEAGALADVTSCTFDVITPTGVVVPFSSVSTPPVAHVSTGRYQLPYLIPFDGVFEYETDGDGQTESSFFLAGNRDLYDAPLEQWCSWADVLRVPVLATTGVQADAAALAQDLQELILDSVSELLWNLSRRVYPGIGKITRSLCVRCSSCHSWWWLLDYPNATDCGCTPYDSIKLGGQYPVIGVREVLLDGVQLDRSAWRLQNNDSIVRLDGMVWPRAKDLTDPTAFQATWFVGNPVPRGGVRAATLMCAEYALLALEKPCLLPQYRVQSAQAEGISYTLVDNTKAVDDGRTGFHPADQWLDSLDVGLELPAGGFDPGDVGVMGLKL